MKVFTGSNPTQLYLDAMKAVIADGEECSPRGKLVKELRPACIEFTEPTNRVTFLHSRRINPFFQLAESLWIISGRSDVAFLEAFNKNMKTFSDDGRFFNASYGERIRFFTKNDLHNIVINPIDQLEDAYLKLKDDPDTRQAVIVISNPLFDNFKYTKGEHGKDIACNLIITFKIRNGALNITVFNRSNDLHWGLFGANLAQFSTIQELMASWLGVKVGTYTHITDSLHIYMDDYGYKITEDVQKAYEHDEDTTQFKFATEPRMNMDFEQTDAFLSGFWGAIEGNLLNDELMTQSPMGLVEALNKQTNFKTSVDDYWMMAVNAMIVYRLVRLGKWAEALEILDQYVPNSQWKVSMVYFLKDMLKKKLYPEESTENEIEYFRQCEKKYMTIIETLIQSLISNDSNEDERVKESLRGYLAL